MGELRIFNKLSKDFKYKVVIGGLSSMVFAVMMSGCNVRNKESYSLSSYVMALNKDDNLTYVDDYLLQGGFYDGEIVNVLEFDEMFLEAYNSRNVSKCNHLIEEISRNILKANISEEYNINYSDLVDFKVTDKGVMFMYNGYLYAVEASLDMACNLCNINSKASNNKLVIYGDGLSVLDSYDILKKSLRMGLIATREYYTSDECNYTGYFDFRYSVERSRAINKNIKGRKKILLNYN